MKTAEELILEKKHYLSQRSIPDYLRNIITVKDVKSIIRLVRKEERAKRKSYAKEHAKKFLQEHIKESGAIYSDEFTEQLYTEWILEHNK